MTYVSRYEANAPTREALDTQPGVVLLEFGADWCGHCQAAQPAIEAALRQPPALTHLKVEDGKGRPLGRSFQVRLWPTLILLRDGRELGRVVRPAGAGALTTLLALLSDNV